MSESSKPVPAPPLAASAGSATGIATRVVSEVLKELRGRKGFGHWWDSIDEETQDELLFTLMEKVQTLIPPNDQAHP